MPREPIDSQGVWWLPEEPDTALTGRLQHPAGGPISLSLIGSFVPRPFGFDNERPVIHGFVDQKIPVTLFNALATGAQHGMPGYATSEYRVMQMIRGAHVDADVVYDELLVETTYLPDWLGASGIAMSHRRRRGSRRASGAVEYVWPPTRRCTLPDGTGVTTTEWHTVSVEGSGGRIDESQLVRFRCPGGLSAQEMIRRYARPLLDLVSFATDRANRFEKIVLRSPKVRRRIAPRRWDKTDLEFFADWIEENVDEPTRRRLALHDCTFLLDERHLRFATIVPRWFQVVDELRDACAPYFAALYAPARYVDVRLIVLAQVLEAYHRLRRPQNKLPKGTFTAVRRALTDACPPEHLQLLKSRLAFLDEPTQKERLNDLREKTAVPLRQLLASSPGFTEAFVGARNARTHAGQPGGRRKKDLAPLDLYACERAADYLFTANLLQELGFPDSLAGTLLEQNAKYQHFVQAFLPSTVLSAQAPP